MKPPEVAAIHRNLCASAKCEYLDRIDYFNSCASCPNGHFGQYEQTGCQEASAGLGDLVASVAQPIARGIDRVLGTNVANCGGCGKRRAKLNELVPFKREKVVDTES